MDEELKRRLDAIDARLARLEGRKETSNKPDADRENTTKADYTGLAGGVRRLMDGGFLDQPKTIDKIIAELNREGYYNTHAGVSSTLSMTFVKRLGILTRIKEGGNWAYVKRK
jgi:hypothetical protein